jgi:hypothetical protein
MDSVVGAALLGTTDAQLQAAVEFEAQQSVGFEAIGTGQSYARMAIEHRAINLNAERAAILAVLGVAQAKEYDGYCGKSTTVTFLKNNLAYEVPWYEIKAVEELFQTYAGIEYSSLIYALANESVNEAKLPRRLTESLRDLRKRFAGVASRLLEHRP